MDGLTSLMMYLEIVEKYMELKNVPNFKLEDFRQGNPTYLKIIEKNEKDKVVLMYEVTSYIDKNKLILLNAKGDNLLELLKKDKNLKEDDLEVFNNIIKKY